MTTGIPINPNYFTGLKYNSAFYNTTGSGLTLAEALTKFLTFPIAQGNETMASVIIADTLTASKNIIMNGATGVSGNYIQFPDGTQQLTAVDPNDYAVLDGSNIFLSKLSPNAPNQQTITGNSLSGNLNAPLVIQNVDTTEFAGLYLDPAPTFDMTLYSNQVGGGLTLRNVEGYSFTMTPSLPNNTAFFSNPISCGTNALTGGSITGTQLTLASGGNSSVLTPSIAGLSINDPLIITDSITLTSGVDSVVLGCQSTGLNISDPMIVSGNVTGTGFNVSTTGSNPYTIYSNSSPSNFGLVIANVTGNDGTLTLSNNSTTLTTLTSTATGLIISDPISVTGSVSCSSLASTGAISGSSLASTGAISGSGLTTTGNITTASNGLGGTSVFNDTQCNFNAISCGGNIGCGSLSSSGAISGGAISGSQLTLTSGTGSTLLTTDTTGLTCNDIITVPTQTYPITSSNQVATISYVNTAISSQGGGDASLSANQTFTGLNTFSQNITLPLQSYVPSADYGNLAATQSFVQQTIYEGIYNNTVVASLSNVTGWESGYAPTTFTFSQIFNQGQQTNSYYLVAYSAPTFSTGVINFTCNFANPIYPDGTTASFLAGTGINCYFATTNQSFNLSTTIVSQYAISCSSGGTTPSSGNGKLTGAFLLSFT